MKNSMYTIAVVATATLLLGCSSSKGSTSTGSSGTTTTISGGSNSAGGNGTGDGGSGGTSGTTGGTDRTTIALPTTTTPGAADWLSAHASDLTALKSAVHDVDATYSAGGDAFKTALIACANAAAPLARTAAGSLPKDQADAITAISVQCAAMTHDLKSGDAASVKDGKALFDAAVIVVTPLFP